MNSRLTDSGFGPWREKSATRALTQHSQASEARGQNGAMRGVKLLVDLKGVAVFVFGTFRSE